MVLCVPPASITGTVSGNLSAAASTTKGLFTAAAEGNLLSTIATDLATAEYNTQVALEYTAICTSLMGIPPSGFILEIQAFLRFLRIRPSPTSTAISMFLIPLIFIAIITFILGFIWNYSRKNWKIAIGVLLILCIIYYFMVIRAPEAFANSNPSKESFQNFDPAPTSPNYTLLNIQPAAAKQVGYIGPSEEGGTFNPSTGILNALNAGVRFLTLQIDYLDSNKPGFESVGVPTLVYRNNSGNIVSSNGESITDVANNLATYAFNSQVPTNEQPLVLYLHFVRTPNYVTSPTKYMTFLSAVAAALQPIQPMILQDDFTRQKNEVGLLNTPLMTFNKKIIVLTNVDTSFFRNAAQLGLATVGSKEDLDAMVHLRVYLEDENDPIGATMVSSSPNAVILSYDHLIALSPPQQVTFAEKGRSRFVIVMPKPVQNPSQKDIAILMKNTGVNILPVNLFGQSYQDFSGNLKAWGAKPFSTMKPVLLQSVKTSTTGYNENFMSSP